MATTSDLAQSTTSSAVPVSTAVVERVSTVTDTPALELPLLQEAIDPDALDAFIAERSTTASVRFHYAGHVVTIHGDQTIEVSPVE